MLFMSAGWGDLVSSGNDVSNAQVVPAFASFGSEEMNDLARAVHSKRLHRVLWLFQLSLAVVFGGAGLLKLFTPVPELVAMGMVWTSRVPEGMVAAIGLLEVIGAIGLVLPTALGLLAGMTGVAAFSFALAMGVAAADHARVSEPSSAILTALLAAVALFVAWGRIVKAPTVPR